MVYFFGGIGILFAFIYVIQAEFIRLHYRGWRNKLSILLTGILCAAVQVGCILGIISYYQLPSALKLLVFGPVILIAYHILEKCREIRD